MLTTDRQWVGVRFTDEAQLEQLARENNVRCIEVDFSHCGNKDDVLFEIARALQFPSYFGQNWDALDECLLDIPDTFPGLGVMFAMRGIVHLWHRDISVLKMLSTILQDASSKLAAVGFMFLLVVVIAPVE